MYRLLFRWFPAWPDRRVESWHPCPMLRSHAGGTGLRVFQLRISYSYSRRIPDEAVPGRTGTAEHMQQMVKMRSSFNRTSNPRWGLRFRERVTLPLQGPSPEDIEGCREPLGNQKGN